VLPVDIKVKYTTSNLIVNYTENNPTQIVPFNIYPFLQEVHISLCSTQVAQLLSHAIH
jgi:hypothetical protein